MPDQQVAPVRTPEQAVTNADSSQLAGSSDAERSSSNLQPRGNFAANEQLAAAGGPEGAATGGAADGGAGLAAYEASLGSFLGKPLYEAVRDNVSWDKIGPSASKAVDGALKALVDQLGSLDKTSDRFEADPKALEALTKILQESLGPHADKLLERYGPELTGKVAQWTQAHPRTILMVALLAAAGAVIANAELPTLKQKLKLGKAANLAIDAKVGRIRALALQKVRAELTLNAAPLKAITELVQKDGKLSGEASLGYGKEGRQLTLDGKFDGQGLTVVGLKGELQVDDTTKVTGNVSKTRDQDPIGTVTVVRQDGKITRTDDYRYDTNTGVFTLGKSALYKDNDYSLRQYTNAGTDGTGSTGVELAAQQGAWSGSLAGEHTIAPGAGATGTGAKGSGAYGLSESDKLKLGLAYKQGDLAAKLDAALSSKAGEASTLDGSFSKGGAAGARIGADFKARLDTGELLELGAFYGFKDPNAFKSFLVEYRYKSQTSESVFGATVETVLRDVKIRWKEQMRWGGTDGTVLDSSVLGAKFFNKDTALLAGVEHRQNFSTGKGSFTPQIGVQHKGVPVTLGYDMERKAVKIGITIPF